MLVPRRHSTDDYRYGFQGQEKDDEIKGDKGNSLNYTFRMHDPRAGRFFAMDPLTKEYPHYSPYSFSGNKLIQAIELEGLEEYLITLRSPLNRDGIDKQIAIVTAKMTQRIDDKAFRVFGHGAPSFTQAFDKKDRQIKLNSPETYDSYIFKSIHAEKWQEMKEKGGTFISLACNNGDVGGIMQMMSKAPENEKIIFIESTEYVTYIDTKEGKVESKTRHHIDKDNSTVVKGVWNIYKGGELIDTKPYDWQPTELDPNTLQKPPKEKSTYEKVKDYFKNFFSDEESKKPKESSCENKS